MSKEKLYFKKGDRVHFSTMMYDPETYQFIGLDSGWGTIVKDIPHEKYNNHLCKKVRVCRDDTGKALWVHGDSVTAPHTGHPAMLNYKSVLARVSRIKNLTWDRPLAFSGLKEGDVVTIMKKPSSTNTQTVECFTRFGIRRLDCYYLDLLSPERGN